MKLCFLMIFDFKSFVFLKPVNIFGWNFQEGILIEVPWNEAILDGHCNCLMPAIPILQKHCFFKKWHKNLASLGKLKIVFALLAAIL